MPASERERAARRAEWSEEEFFRIWLARRRARARRQATVFVAAGLTGMVWLVWRWLTS